MYNIAGGSLDPYLKERGSKNTKNKFSISIGECGKHSQTVRGPLVLNLHSLTFKGSSSPSKSKYLNIMFMREHKCETMTFVTDDLIIYSTYWDQVISRVISKAAICLIAYIIFELLYFMRVKHFSDDKLEL